MSDMEEVGKMLDRLADVEDQIKTLTREKNVLRNEIQHRMDDADVQSFKSKNGKGVTLSDPKIRISVKAEEREEFISFLDSIGEGSVAPRYFTPAAANKVISYLYENEGVDAIPEKWQDKIDFYQSITLRGLKGGNA